MRSGTYARILDAALELFAENGFHTTTIDKIARKAGISKGLIYNHFKSKDDLLNAVFDTGFGEMEKIFPALDVIQTPEKLIRIYIEIFFESFKHNNRFWRLYFMVTLQPDIFGRIQDRLNKMFDYFIKRLQAHFQQLGSPAPFIDSLVLGAAMDGIAFQSILRGEEWPADELKERLIEIFCST